LCGTLKDDEPDGQEILIVAYGLHTLLLKNHKKRPESSILHSVLEKFMSAGKSWHSKNRSAHRFSELQIWHRGACSTYLFQKMLASISLYLIRVSTISQTNNFILLK
jgi:hypothetical protein